jgi:hypothetical protein
MFQEALSLLFFQMNSQLSSETLQKLVMIEATTFVDINSCKQFFSLPTFLGTSVEYLRQNKLSFKLFVIWVFYKSVGQEALKQHALDFGIKIRLIKIVPQIEE